MKYGICNLAIAPIRSEASDESEIVSQLLFGDHVEILIDGQPWIRVKNHFDGYSGWMDFKQLVFIDRETYHKGIGVKHFPVVSKTLSLTGPKGEISILLGSSLPFFNGETCQLGSETYEVNESVETASYSDIKRLSQYFLNAPYLWGGKSVYGIDCSGLVQNIFKAINISLPRDASQQVITESKNIQWSDRLVGDVAFYTTSSDKVTHVGILISKDEIIHAHGRVRIDFADLKGIYNDEQDKYTHKFHSLKRFS